MMVRIEVRVGYFDNLDPSKGGAAGVPQYEQAATKGNSRHGNVSASNEKA